MKVVSLLIMSFCFCVALLAQKNIPSTDSFLILGKVETERIIAISDLQKYPKYDIKPVKIISHKGEKKQKTPKMKGVLLIDVLEETKFVIEHKKQLSELYFVLEASDGYRVVYSWNELYNTATGKNTFIVVEKDGKSIADFAERIIVITPTDIQTGRRYVKGLSRVKICRAE